MYSGANGIVQESNLSNNQALTPITVTSASPFAEIFGTIPATPAASATQQTLTITGRNFTSNATVSLCDPTGNRVSVAPTARTATTAITISYAFATSGDWTVTVTNPGSLGSQLHFSVSTAGTLVTDGFDYPIGNRGYGTYGQAISLESLVPEPNDLYSLDPNACHPEQDPDRGGTSGNLGLTDGWYDAEDVGSYLGVYNGVSIGGIHPGEDWTSRAAVPASLYMRLPMVL